MVLPFSLFCFRFKNERRIFFSCPQTFLHFVPTLQCQICGFVFSTTAPSAIWTIWRIKLHTCVKAARYFQLWHAIINRIGNIGPVVNAHARYNFLYSHIYLHLSAPVKRCCTFYLQNISYLIWEWIAQNERRVKLEEVYHFIPNVDQSVFTCY